MVTVRWSMTVRRPTRSAFSQGTLTVMSLWRIWIVRYSRASRREPHASPSSRPSPRRGVDRRPCRRCRTRGPPRCRYPSPSLKKNRQRPPAGDRVTSYRVLHRRLTEPQRGQPGPMQPPVPEGFGSRPALSASFNVSTEVILGVGRDVPLGWSDHGRDPELGALLEPPSACDAAAAGRSGRSRRRRPGPRARATPRAAEAIASAIARSAAGSSIRTPPATFTNTSAEPSGSRRAAPSTARIIARRLRSTPVPRRRGIAARSARRAPAPRAAAAACPRARSATAAPDPPGCVVGRAASDGSGTADEPAPPSSRTRRSRPSSRTGSSPRAGRGARGSGRPRT